MPDPTALAAHEQPTADDLAIDPRALLESCLYCVRLGIAIDGRDVLRVVVALCRRLIAREYDIAHRDMVEAGLRRQYDEASTVCRIAADEVRQLRADAGRMRAFLLAMARDARDDKRTVERLNAAIEINAIAEALGVTTDELVAEMDA